MDFNDLGSEFVTWVDVEKVATMAGKAARYMVYGV
jgi:hypothetical protein